MWWWHFILDFWQVRFLAAPLPIQLHLNGLRKAAETAQEPGPLLSMWETRIEFLDPALAWSSHSKQADGRSFTLSLSLGLSAFQIIKKWVSKSWSKGRTGREHFRAKNITKDKEIEFIMSKRIKHQEDITIVYVCIWWPSVSICKNSKCC